jgi:hypothetical protein
VGEVIAETSATVLQMSLTLAGDISTFGATERAALAASLSQLLGCFKPSCYLSLSVTGGSVSVMATLNIPDAPAAAGLSDSTASSSATAVVIQAARNLLAQPVQDISSSLGMTVEAAAPLAVTHQVVPLVVAPLPPSPPSPPPPWPPPPPVPASGGSSSGDGGVDASVFVGAACGLGAVTLVLVGLAVRHCRTRRAHTPMKEHAGLEFERRGVPIQVHQEI